MTDKFIPFPVKQDNADCVAILSDWLEKAQAGEIVTVGLIGKCVGGEWQTGMSASANSLEDAAMLMQLAMRRLGFINR